MFLIIGPPLLVTALCAALARSRGVRDAFRRALGLAAILVLLGTYWLLLPEDPLLRFLIFVFLGLPASFGNLAALELRLRREVDSSYLVDVLTLSSGRLTHHLNPRSERLGMVFLRGLAFGGASLAATLLLRRLHDEALGFWCWTYLKLLVFACSAQAVSDVMYAACRGRIVPLARMPMLARSYDDFWSRRYNLWVHGFLRWFARDVLGLARRPLLMVAAVFALSGALHEYLSFCVLREVNGYWAAFWAAQLLLTFSSLGLRRLTRRRFVPTAIDVVFLHATMLLTAPLFFGVVDRFLNFFGPPTRIW